MVAIKKYVTAPNLADSCVLIISAILLFFHLSRTFVYAVTIDDWEHLAAGWYIYQGFFPYIDFFQHHNPLWWYLLAPIFYFVKNPYHSYEVARIITALFWIGDLFLIGGIVIKLGGKIRTLIYTLFIYLAFPISYFCYIQNRPDTPMIFFMLLGLYFWISYISHQKLYQLMMCYLSLTVSFLFLQKMALFIFPFGIYQLYLLWKKELNRPYFLYAIFPSIILLCLFIFHLYQMDALERYWQLNYILNLNIVRDTQIYKTRFFEYLLRVLTALGLIWGILKGRGLKRQLCFLILGFTLVFMMIPKPYEYYWFIWLPFASIILGWYLSQIKTPSFRFEIVLPYFCACLFFISGVSHGYDYSIFEMKAQLARKNSASIVTSNNPLYAFLNTAPRTYYYIGREYASLDRKLFHEFHFVPNYKELIEVYQPHYIATNYPYETNSKAYSSMNITPQELSQNYHKIPYRILEIWERNENPK